VLTRLFSARRSRDLLIVLVLSAFVFLYLVLRAMRPERLLEEESFGTLVEFLQMFSAPESRYLPTLWMTEALFPALLKTPAASPLPALGVWTTAAALLAIGGWIGTALYKNAYARAQEGRLRWRMGRRGAAEKSRLLGRWMDRLGGLLGRLTGSLMVKDVRVFLRDTNQWMQLLLLGALAAVYLLNFVYLKVANFSWFTLYTVNHVLMGLVISGIAVRFVFPAVSLEGRAFWIVRSAPVRMGAFLHSKLLIHFIPLAALGVFLSVLSCTVIGVPLVFVVLSVALMLAMTLGVCSLGVGIGALHPRFTVENPAKIPTGIGGVVFMIVSMGFVIVFLLASFYPTFLLFRLPTQPDHPVHRPFWLALSLAVLLILGLGAAVIPMALGSRKLQRLDE
jgi:ABC-2 type transport system permease protein